LGYVRVRDDMVVQEPGFVRGYAYLFLTQVMSRLLPFVVNIMVARRLTPEEYGVPTVHFQLISTIILTCREGFRRALMRDAGSGTADSDVTDASQGDILSFCSFEP